MNKVKFGLFSLDNKELFYTNTLEIENLISILKSTNLLSKNKITIKDILELEAIYSSEVEGYFTTRKELSKFIKNEKNPSTKDEKAVYSNYLALKYGMENSHKIYSKDFLIKLNSIILDEEILDFRKDSVYISNKKGDIVHEGLPFSKLNYYTNSLIEFAKRKDIEPLIGACVIHFYFVYIHPFLDGNGRTARAYSYIYLINKGMKDYNLFSISYILPQKRNKYYKHLKEIEDNEYDLTNFISFMLKIMTDAVADIDEKYALINIINNTKEIYKIFKLEYTQLTETILNFIHTKENFTLENFYKKNKSKFIRFGYSEESFKKETENTIKILLKHQIIDKNYKINENIK